MGLVVWGFLGLGFFLVFRIFCKKTNIVRMKNISWKTPTHSLFIQKEWSQSVCLQCWGQTDAGFLCLCSKQDEWGPAVSQQLQSWGGTALCQHTWLTELTYLGAWTITQLLVLARAERTKTGRWQGKSAWILLFFALPFGRLTSALQCTSAWTLVLISIC